MSSNRTLRKNLAKSVLALAIGATTIASPTVFADETTGTIRGSVVGVENVTKIKLTDTARGISKEIGIDADGDFRFGSLTPGKYQLQVFNDGGVVDTQTVMVGLGGTASIVLGQGADLEEVVVNGERISQVDVGIAESGMVISSEELIEIPVARDLTSVTLLAPSVSKGDRTFGDNASFAGASVAENVSYINGLNTTNFRNGLGFSKVPFEFYDSIQVKTGGYSAKFGRSTGGVMNATTKSGSNEFKAGSSFYYDEQLETSPNTYAAVNDRDVFDSSEANVYASGAIIPDRLFFYALYSKDVENEEYYGMTSGRGYKAKTDTDFWGVKLDGYINENHRVELTAFSDERDIVEGAYGYDSDTDVVGDYVGDTVYERGGMNWIASYIGNLNDAMTLSVSYGENEQSRSTIPGNSDSPAVYLDDGGLTALGDWLSLSMSEGEDTREMVRVDFSWDLNDHFIEVGLDQEINSSSSNTFYSGGQYWRLYPADGLARQRIYKAGGTFEVESNAFYLQDTWQVTDTLSLQAGLRNETFTNKNSEGSPFIEVDNQWAPRLSAVWDPTGAGNQKVFANWGMYYLPIASNTNIRMAGNELFTQEYFDWDGSCLNADSTPCNLGDSYGLGYFADGSVPDTRSLVDTNIEPMYQSEFILGYEYVMDNGIQLGVKGMYRNLETSIEDVAIDAAVIDYYNSTGSWDASKVDGDTVEDVFGGFHQYVLTNPGNDMRIYIPEMDEFVNLSAGQLNYPEAKRQYGALEFTFKRPFDGKWALDASYTWGHSWGNNEGYVRSDNGQDDAGLTTNFDQPGLLDGGYGNLPNDRRHTVKAFGNYQFDMGLRLGANFMWQTGRPKNCFGVHPTDVFAQAYGSESFYCQGESTPRGSFGRTDNVWNLDVSAQYPVQFGNNQELLLTMDVFNILNSDTVVESQEIGDNEATGAPYEFFGEPVYYQDPRSIRFGVRYDFN
ncbi:TonB-dependent receptor [Microbulbifer marinus]|uniref:TonB-dependent Receptor Plug Domain n=1 Tax=Microbulbifer marinus TaxID=658218 RepID=A0A1H4BDI6_9GAMM|nr:TonB-dependent receptor [Microbulbifer marinus]SEA46114.1 TonB-dependent Receptor Plug Domain [Microbulbifer marinus]